MIILKIKLYWPRIDAEQRESEIASSVEVNRNTLQPDVSSRSRLPFSDSRFSEFIRG